MRIAVGGEKRCMYPVIHEIRYLLPFYTPLIFMPVNRAFQEDHALTETSYDAVYVFQIVRHGSSNPNHCLAANILVSEQREESYRRKPYKCTFMFHIFNHYREKG